MNDGALTLAAVRCPHNGGLNLCAECARDYFRGESRP